MKTAFYLGLGLIALATGRAQVFRPEAVNGALLGGVAGAVIGNNSGDLHHNAWKGAAIGAGAGLLMGEVIGNAHAARMNPQVASPGGYVYGERRSPVVSVGVGYSNRGYHDTYRHPGHRGRGYYGGGHSGYSGGYGYSGFYGNYPAYGYYDGYGPGYPYYGVDNYPYYGGDNYSTYGGSGAANGLLLGALAGGIIGNNSGDLRHNAWRGAAWGAGAGWLLGTIADTNRRAVSYQAQPMVVQPAPLVQAQPTAQQPPAQPVTIINNYYNSSTPMSPVNSMFGR